MQQIVEEEEDLFDEDEDDECSDEDEEKKGESDCNTFSSRLEKNEI